VERLVKDHPSEWDQIRSSVQAVRAVLPTLDQQTLSSAAKTYLIIAESEEGVEQEQIPNLAKRLGWELSPAQVDKTVALLDQLRLLDGESNEPVHGTGATSSREQPSR
jgi:hypothetical protein